MSLLLYQPAFDSDCPPPGFRLRDTAGAELLRAAPDERVFDLGPLGLSPGRHTVVVSAVDDFGTEGEGRQIEVVIADEGDVLVELVGVRQVQARPRTAGGVRLNWLSYQDSGQPQVPAAAFEVARGAAGPADVVAVVPANGGAQYQFDLARADHGFADGQHLRLWVRSSDGVDGGSRTAWVDAGRVVIDASGPPAPMVLQGARPQC